MFQCSIHKLLSIHSRSDSGIIFSGRPKRLAVIGFMMRSETNGWKNKADLCLVYIVNIDIKSDITELSEELCFTCFIITLQVRCTYKTAKGLCHNLLISFFYN